MFKKKHHTEEDIRSIVRDEVALIKWRTFCGEIKEGDYVEFDGLVFEVCDASRGVAYDYLEHPHCTYKSVWYKTLTLKIGDQKKMTTIDPDKVQKIKIVPKPKAKKEKS